MTIVICGMTGVEEAEKRISEEAKLKTGSLDLSNLGLTEIPQSLFALVHLKNLNLGSDYRYGRVNYITKLPQKLRNLQNLKKIDLSYNPIKNLTSLKQLTQLHTLNCSRTRISVFEPIEFLTELTSLDCSHNEIESIELIGKLTRLQTLNCSGNNISSFEPIGVLTQLKSLICSNTKISSLDPISALTELTTLNCSHNQIKSLEPLRALTKLQTLNCSDNSINSFEAISLPTEITILNCSNNQMKSLEAVSTLTKLQSLICSDNSINSLKSIDLLTELTSLDCSGTKIESIELLSTLTRLQTLSCSENNISSLEPIRALTQLKSLTCSSTKISSLVPISVLTELTTFNCANSQVKSLEPLRTLTKLQTLNCSANNISSFEPIRALTQLKSLTCQKTKIRSLKDIGSIATLTDLNFRDTNISSLKHLSSLSQLVSLDCSETNITSLKPLHSLSKLRSLSCSETKITSLEPLESILTLEDISFFKTQVSSLEPVQNLINLTYLDCESTKVTSLKHLKNLIKLDSLDASYTRLNHCEKSILLKNSLTDLVLYETYIPGIPPEVLSEDEWSDCKKNLMAHFADLGDNPEPLNRVKTMILGNGRVGKTQICRKLSGLDMEEESTSTHGIVTSAIRLDDDTSTPDFQLWDFGGQDIYHGAHALFVKGRAIFIVAWNEAAENCGTHTHNDLVFRNEPLTYWVEFIRHLSGFQNPLIIVQTHCEDPGSEAVFPPLEPERLNPFPYRKTLAFGAKTGRGLASLKESLAEAAKFVPQPLIGPGRLDVKRQIEDMKNNQNDHAVQILSFEDFKNMCNVTGRISDVGLFAQFLHNSDTIFYQKNLFDNQIIIDPSWAFEAIYSIFNRDKCYSILKNMKGRFTKSLIGILLWDEDYTPKEQNIFLGMMVSCGICFHHSPRYRATNDDIEYIAPDLLPETKPVNTLMGRWEDDQETTELIIEFDLMPSSIFRNIMSEIGGEAGTSGIYWKNGLYVYENKLRSHALIEVHYGDDFKGQISIKTQAGDAEEFNRNLHKKIDKVVQNIGLKSNTPYEDKSGKSRLDPLDTVPEIIGKPAKEITFDFGVKADQDTRAQIYVSYAWKDDKTANGKKREKEVDLLCKKAETGGIIVKRDKNELRTGDSLRTYMHNLSQGKRIFVFLSDKYLRSYACMLELYNIWVNTMQDEALFLRTIRVFRLDAEIFRPKNRLKYSEYWKAESEKLETIINRNLAGTSHRSHAEYKLAVDVYQNIDEILSLIADKLLPSDFEEFFKNGFDDLES